MSRISMKAIREMDEAELRTRIQENRSELTKLYTGLSRGTLGKEHGKIKPIRRDIARMMTRLTEMKK